ncbi:MAG: hypothetical protein ACO3QV_05755, partial [Candidatus Nanopelagicaceae bacterium]
KGKQKKSSWLMRLVENDSYRRNLLLIPLIALLIKIIFIIRIGATAWPGIDPNQYRLANFWLGADGENYISGLNALVRDGIFSPEGILNYWPAGYPILLYFFGLPFRSWTLVSTGVVQTIIYAIATAYFVDTLARTRLKRFVVPIALILAFNPTLAFGTYSIGYESFVAALVLLAVALMVREYQAQRISWLSREAVIAALLISLSSFMQPRMVVTGFLLFLFWALATRPRKIALGFLAATMAISLIFPAFLVMRNVVATDQTSISTNLGVTMRIGAGPGASGGYNNGGSELECPEIEGTAAEKDNAVVRCVINWYVDNPGEAIPLMARKALYYWSPWFGPVANGTMARNPWNQNHPLRSTVQTQEGYDLVYGITGKVLSWLWVAGTLGFLLLGFLVMWRINGVERLLGIVSLSIILINMLVSMATIGDHRFRLPAAGLSLFLQVVGVTWALSKRKRRSFGPENQLLWKSLSRTTNLPT